jgi:DDB1- and CUL4-associated factor 7
MSAQTTLHHTHDTPWPVYALHWSRRPGSFRLGFSSFLADLTNKVATPNKIRIVQQTPKQKLVKIAETEHSYPVTKFLWSPYKPMTPDLFATTGDYFRLWELVNPDEIGDEAEDLPLLLRATLANVRKVGQVVGLIL